MFMEANKMASINDEIDRLDGGWSRRNGHARIDFCDHPRSPDPPDSKPPRQMIGEEPCASTEEFGILLSTVQPERVEWLWQDRIPLGKLTIIDGDPGLGKSVLTLDLAARVSRGIEMPDGSSGRSGGVVLLSAEDGLSDTIRP